MSRSRLVKAILAKEEIFYKIVQHLNSHINSLETTADDNNLNSQLHSIQEKYKTIGTYTLSKNELATIINLSTASYSDALKKLQMANTVKDRDHALGRLTVWTTNISSIISIIGVKYNDGKFEQDADEVLALSMNAYKKYKEMQKILDQVFVNTTDAKVRERLDWISLRTTTICQVIGYIHLFHSKNPHAALSYLTEEIELLEANKTAAKLKDYALVQVYNLYAYNLIILGDLSLGRYYLTKLKSMLQGEKDSHDDSSIENRLGIVFDKYYNALDAYIKTIPDELNETSLARLQDVKSILRAEDLNYEPYLKKVSTLLTAQIKATVKQKSTDYREAALLALTLSNLRPCKDNKTYIDFGKKNIAFIAKKLLPTYSSILKDAALNDAPYEINFDTENLSLQINLKTDSKLKPLNKITINDITYVTKKLASLCYFEIPLSDFCGENLASFIQNIASAKMFNTDDTISKTSDNLVKLTPGQVTKPINKDIPLSKQEETDEDQNAKKQVKVKIEGKYKTRGEPNKNESPKAEETQITQEAEISDAECLGFDKRFNSFEIFPIRASVFPEGRYFGFYSRENTHPKEVAEETHTQAVNTLISGKVSAKSPAIKIVKNKGNDSDMLFKLAPLCDFRMFGHKVQDVTDSNGRVIRSLIAFDTPATHSTQKKFY